MLPSLAVSLLVALPMQSNAASEPIRYVLRFPAPQTHYVEVEADVPTGGRPAVELMMAVWTPGSYLVREYARNVEGLAATDPGGRARPGREGPQEPLAGRDRAGPTGSVVLPRLRPRDVGADELDRRRRSPCSTARRPS